MKRKIRMSEKLLIFCYSIVLLFLLLHDWVPLGTLNDVEAVKADKSTNELLLTTLIGVTQILLLMGIVLFYFGRKHPLWIKLWLIIHPACIFAGAIMDWWLPYLFGIGAEERVERYSQMFGDTHAFLPVMHGIVPNTLHTIFHMSLFFCIILMIYISLTKNTKLEHIKKLSA
ncbi:hypothetical protein ACFSTA_03785 [Ornithinibacillus salinisoli]|uniref:DUF1440 domain-containing protein n=1 Tax=Ornithinibacillus salinisoli TaxID=1848459 RepID=A0ABW4VWC8_9BACI